MFSTTCSFQFIRGGKNREGIKFCDQELCVLTTTLIGSPDPHPLYEYPLTLQLAAGRVIMEFSIVPSLRGGELIKIETNVVWRKDSVQIFRREEYNELRDIIRQEFYPSRNRWTGEATRLAVPVNRYMKMLPIMIRECRQQPYAKNIELPSVKALDQQLSHLDQFGNVWPNPRPLRMDMTAREFTLAFLGLPLLVIHRKTDEVYAAAPTLEALKQGFQEKNLSETAFELEPRPPQAAVA